MPDRQRERDDGGWVGVFVRRPVLAVVLNLLIIVAGFAALQGIEIRELPDVDRPVVTVRTSYPGATPESIDAQITAIIESAVSSAAILALVGFANVFGWILVSERIPQMIASSVLSFTDNKYVVILLINLLLLFVGMFMETIAALIILFVPLLTLAQGVGVDPLHFATFAVLNLMIGLTTPPVGVCLFICANIAKLPLTPVIKAIAPFLLTNILVLLLVSYVPAIATWLPSLLLD